MKDNDEQTLSRIKELEAAVKQLTNQGVRCGQCVHLDHCAKNPTPKSKLCICFECEVVRL